MRKLNIVVFATFAFTALIRAEERNWQYTMIRFEWNSTDEDILAAPLEPVQASDKGFALAGSLIFKKPLDNSYKIAIKIYHSPGEDNPYKLLPFGIPMTPFITFMNTIYKKYLMNDLKECSNLPVFKGYYAGPVPPNTYKLDSCAPKTDSMPTNLPFGYYRIVVEIQAPNVHLVAVLSVKIFEK